LQREILNVAKACQLPGFRYVRFAPVLIAPRAIAAEPEAEVHAEADIAAAPAPPGEVASELAVPAVAASPVAAPPVAAPPVAAVPVAAVPVAAALAAPVAAEAPQAATAAEQPAPETAIRAFALLEEMNRAIAARTPHRGSSRPAADPRGEAMPLAPPIINRTIRSVRPPAEAPAPDASAPERPLLAEITATLQRRRPAAAAEATPRAPRRTPTSRTL
jgi:hypothetical protein